MPATSSAHVLLALAGLAGASSATHIQSYGEQRWCFGDRVIPSLFLIGAQKCGSSTLALELSNMLRTVSLRGRDLHETHYFDKDVVYRAGVSNYAAQWPARCPYGASARHDLQNRTVYAIDYTPAYVRYRHVPQRIDEVYGPWSKRLKFIVIVRSPVNRIKSWYFHIAIKFYKGDNQLDTLNKWVPHVLEAAHKCASHHGHPMHTSRFWGLPCSEASVDALFGGLYGPQLDHYFKYFDPSQFLLISLSGYVKAPAEVRADMAEHIFGKHHPGSQLSREEQRSGMLSQNRHSADESLSDKSRGKLDEFYRPHNAHFLATVRYAARHRSLKLSPASIGPFTEENTLDL
jgi:hypothetical protein